MSESRILDSLEKLEKKVDKIETAVGLIAVQSERINTLSSQISTLWLKYDVAFGQEGVVTSVKTFQATCPRKSLKETIDRQWVAIGLIATVLCGTVLKILGVL